MKRAFVFCRLKAFKQFNFFFGHILNVFPVCAGCIPQFSAITKKNVDFHIWAALVLGLPKAPVDAGGVTGMG